VSSWRGASAIAGRTRRFVSDTRAAAAILMAHHHMRGTAGADSGVVLVAKGYVPEIKV
jgi:hypothetical protein